MTPTALHSQRHPREAKEGTFQNLAAHNTVSLHLVTPVTGPGRTHGSIGRTHGAHYGDAYDRGD
eukprot:3602719-Prymnesium_polylepis.1